MYPSLHQYKTITRSYFYVGLMVLLTSFEVQAQWTPAQLSSDRCNMAATTVGNKAFFAGGTVSGPDIKSRATAQSNLDLKVGATVEKSSTTVDIYDNNTNTWSKANLSAARSELAAASAGTKAFFAGGYTGSHNSNVVDIYDSKTNSWTQSKLSEARRQLCATSAGSKVFFAGGHNSGDTETSDVVDIYDINTNTWSTQKLSKPRYWLAAASVGTKVFFAGGLDAHSASYSLVDIYDIKTNTWSTHELSQPRFDLAATYVEHKVLFAGGRNGIGESDVVDIYDYDSNSWSSFRLSQPRFDLSATSVDNKAIFAGGHTRGDAGYATSNVVDIYDASTNTWYTSTLPSSRNSMGATSVGTKAIFAGGWSSTTSEPVRDVSIYETDSKAPEVSIGYKNNGALNANGKFDIEILITDSSPITRVVINEEVKAIAKPNDTLTFNIEMTLGAELAVFASDKFGTSMQGKFPIHPPLSTDVQGNGALSSNAIKRPRYHALLMAVEKYADPTIKPLSEPVKDATLLKDVLAKKYNFDKGDIMILKNPTTEEVSLAFDSLTRKITPEDYLLIFYAGHGGLDMNTNLGFWLLSDGSKTNKARWYRNSALREDIAAINSKHTLLITDACFSGGIFNARGLDNNASLGINNMMKLPSRKAMTSGAQTTVPDKSVFMKYLLKYLQDNDKQFLPSADLYYSIRMAMNNNADTVPQYGEIQQAGDEGGDFVFYQPNK